MLWRKIVGNTCWPRFAWSSLGIHPRMRGPKMVCVCVLLFMIKQFYVHRNTNFQSMSNDSQEEFENQGVTESQGESSRVWESRRFKESQVQTRRLEHSRGESRRVEMIQGVTESQRVKESENQRESQKVKEILRIKESLGEGSKRRESRRVNDSYHYHHHHHQFNIHFLLRWIKGMDGCFPKALGRQSTFSNILGPPV